MVSFKLLFLIFLGTESPNHTFRHIGFGLSLKEDQEAYEFALSSIKNYLKDSLNYTYEPKFSMSDHHLGGLSALSTVFPNITRLRCLFHIGQNVEKKLRSLGLKKHLIYVRWVLKILSESKSKEDFDNLWELLEPEIRKITESEPFVLYFKEQIIDSTSLWFCGASFIGKQKCNNSLEGLNRYLKSNWTKQESKSVPEFMVVMEKAFSYYVGKCREEKCMPVDCKFLREYYRKASEIIAKKHVFKLREDVFLFLKIPNRFKNSVQSREKETLERLLKVNETIEFIKNNENEKFASLSNYSKIGLFFSYYQITTKICSCKTFWNRGICKHVLASEMFLGRIEDPYTKKIVEGSQVGRPKNLQRT